MFTGIIGHIVTLMKWQRKFCSTDNIDRKMKWQLLTRVDGTGREGEP